VHTCTYIYKCLGTYGFVICRTNSLLASMDLYHLGRTDSQMQNIVRRNEKKKKKSEKLNRKCSM
jgi:hypothetical protein